MKKTLLFWGLILEILGCSQKLPIKYSGSISGNKEYKVVLMGGQSNMVGKGKMKDLEKQDFGNISYFDFGLEPDFTNSVDNFGPEVGVAEALNNEFSNDNFILIKYAIGGSSLLDWSPNYSKEKAEITGYPEFGNMYNSLFAKIDSVMPGLNYEIVAFLWMQGERDARIPEAGKDYYNNFKQLIDSLRNDLNKPNLPIIYGKISPPKSRYPALDTVLLAQLKINRDIENTYIIDTDDIETWADSTHYSSNGQLKLGKKFGAKLVEILEARRE